MSRVNTNNLPSTGLRSKSKKLDILRTFEIFNKESLGILKDKIIEIILVEADNIFSKNKKIFDIDFKNDKSIQISVVNDKEAYNLLSNTWKRHKLKQGKLNDKDNKDTIFDQLPEPERMPRL